MKTITLFLFLLAPLIALGQITQIGQDIDGEAEWDFFGSSVSLNSDGSIVAIGGPENDGGGYSSGHVRVFQLDGNTWTQIGQDIDGANWYYSFGHSVSLSEDGTIIAIGTNPEEFGYVQVYQYLNGSWVKIGGDMSGGTPWYDCFGFSVSLSSDGTIVAIGDRCGVINGIDTGYVRIYQNISGAWTQIGQDIGGEISGDQFGHSVSLSENGNIVAIGAPGPFGNSDGYARVYENIGGNWIKVGNDIVGNGPFGFGYSVSLSSDGTVMAIGNENIGALKVYKNIDGTWVQFGQSISDCKDSSVSISSDGFVLIQGCPWWDRARIYQFIDNAWTQIGQDINGEAQDNLFGASVSISTDRNTLAIGAPRNDGINGMYSGHVRVFDLSSVLEVDDYSSFDFAIYPSPTSGILNINSESTITQIEIYNLLGQLVQSNTNQNTIDISSVDQGVYFVKVMDENGNVGTQKVVKK